MLLFSARSKVTIIAHLSFLSSTWRDLYQLDALNPQNGVLTVASFPLARP